MSWAIRNDGQGWRSVDSAGDVLAGERYIATADGPPPAPALPPLAPLAVEELRLRAYADPITGSDRYFSEASRIRASGGTSQEADVATASGVARAAEIQALYPWPK